MKGEIILLKLKRTIMYILIYTVLILFSLNILICYAYLLTDGTMFKINDEYVKFDGLTYGDLKGFEIQPNEVFIVTGGDEQIDITQCDCKDEDIIKSLTVVVMDTKQVCNFSVFGISVGDSGDVVMNNMPEETIHILDDNTNVRISKYIDKDNNIIIVGTDVELDIVSYVTIRDGD